MIKKYIEQGVLDERFPEVSALIKESISQNVVREIFVHNDKAISFIKILCRITLKSIQKYKINYNLTENYKRPIMNIYELVPYTDADHDNYIKCQMDAFEKYILEFFGVCDMAIMENHLKQLKPNLLKISVNHRYSL